MTLCQHLRYLELHIVVFILCYMMFMSHLNSSHLKYFILLLLLKYWNTNLYLVFWEMASAHPMSVSTGALLACFTALLSLMVRSWCCASLSLSLSLCLCSWNRPASKRDTHYCTYISIKYIPHAQGAMLDTVSPSSGSRAVLHITLAHLGSL